MLRTSQEASIDKVRQLIPLQGLGSNGAWLLVRAFLGWRALQNRREVGLSQWRGSYSWPCGAS